MGNLGIDIGGTFIKYVYKDEEGEKKGKEYVRDIIQKNDLDGFLEKVLKIIKKFNPEKVGIAVAGLVDKKEGVITESPNLKILNNFPLKSKLENLTNIPVFIENDANLAALGEWKYGAGKGKDISICLTLGTGLGGGAVLNGQLLSGVSGSAMEIGHITIVKDGRQCHCGRHGCLEAYVSSYGLERIYFLKTDKYKDSGEIILEANEGKEDAMESLEEFSEYLAVGLMNITHIFNPDVIILSGGIIENYPLIKDMSLSYLKHFAFNLPFRDLELKVAELGEFSGAYGALELTQQNTI